MVTVKKHVLLVTSGDEQEIEAVDALIRDVADYEIVWGGIFCAVKLFCPLSSWTTVEDMSV